MSPPEGEDNDPSGQTEPQTLKTKLTVVVSKGNWKQSQDSEGDTV